MNVAWFFLALAGPLLWALGNFIDKGLLERLRVTTAPYGVLILYSSLFSLIVMPTTYYASGFSALSLSAHSISILIIAGIIEMIAIGLYLSALAQDETSIIVPLFQTIPIFSLILGYILLGEILTKIQIFAGAIVMGGSMVLTLEFSEERRATIKTRILVLALISSGGFALFDALFKYATTTESFWAAVFWQHVGIFSVGVALFIFNAHYRRSFVKNVTTNGMIVFGFNVLNEFLYVIGMLFMTFALLLAPIALVATVSVYQPVFVFLLGILLTIFLPHLIHEKISAKHLLHKGIAIGIILTGSILLVLQGT